jgi:putative membrane protein
MTLLDSLQGFPSFLAYLALALVLLVLFGFLYSAVTPHREFKLIQQNQPAAAIAFGGALVGFVLPLSSAISNSVSLLDCALWGFIALVVQLLVWFFLRLVLRDLPQRITQGELAAGIFAAFVAIAVGLLNAACMTW